MGMMRRWLTWWVVIGLVSVFAAHRVFHDVVAVRLPLSVLGFAVVFGATVWKIRSWSRSDGPTRSIERVFALAYLGCSLALVGFMIGTEDGVRWLALDLSDPLYDLRFRRGVLIGSSIFLAASLLPALAAQWALRYGGGGAPGTLAIESRRVSESAANALSVALAGAFLAVGGYVTAAQNKTFDASYFKTSSPGSAVTEIVRNSDQSLTVAFFFPEANPVKDEVERYFRNLADATGNVTVEAYDRLAEPQVAAEYDVRIDGTILLFQGDRTQRLLVPTELRAARSRLRLLDGEVQGALLKLQRGQRVAYMTTGHGELNDPFRERDAESREGGGPPLEALREIIGLMSYEIRELGLRTGLGSAIPDDAVFLLAIGPQRPFLEEEIEVVREFLDRGGSLLLALDPGSEFTLDGLRGHLGLEFRSVTLADEQSHMRQTGRLSDRRLIVTDRILSHASVTSAGRRGVGSAILLAGSGYLTETQDEDTEGLQRWFVIQSRPSTFADLNGNMRFDEGSETRGPYDVVAAIEGPDRGDSAGMRALVYADADMFTDRVLISLGMNAAVVADGIRWLGREETFAGEIVSEADVPIVHTRAEDVAWFYAIIFGAPALVLIMGLIQFLSPRIPRKVS